MVPRPLAPARAMISHTCADVIQPCSWVQLKPCYAHAHGCTQAFLPPVIVAFSNFSGVGWT